MSKSFKDRVANGFDTLLGSDQDKPQKQVPVKQITNKSQEGTKPGETRATFIVTEDSLEKLKQVAYWDRKSIKAVINEALSDYLATREKTKGKIKPIPDE